MTRKRRRLWILVLSMIGLGSAAALALNAFQDNLVFFYAPSDVLAKKVPVERRFRLGGLVEPASLSRADDGVTLRFRVTDGANTLPVEYRGQLPDLFREGQGVVAEGALNAAGVFAAREVLAKHDENYMPPEVAAALKKTGRWKEGEEQPGKIAK